MKNICTIFLAFFLALNLLAQPNKKVLIIGIDGCRPDALKLAYTPNLDNLIENGLYSPDALNDDITISGPGWSAILTSVWSPKHGVTGNSFSGSNYDAYPHIFKHIEDHNPDFHTASICHWGPINDQIVQDHADYKANTSSDAGVAIAAAAYLGTSDPDILFLHFDDADHAGHSYGFSPLAPEYIQAITTIDINIGTVLNAIENRTSYEEEDWLILVSTDHGGLGTSHGGTSIQEENTFVIASGNNVPQQLILKDSTTILDAPFNCLADTVELSFDGVNDNVQIAPNPLFDFGSSQDFTIECRVRTNTAADVAIVGNKDWDSGSFEGFVFSFKYPSGPQWKVNIGDGSNRVDINTGAEIADNEWHTLSVTFDRDGYMVMYQDGIAADSALITSIGDINTGAGLFFGTDILNAYDFEGSISEVRVWNQVLSASAISAWACISVDNTHPNYADLIGHWKLNEGAGTLIVYDYSPYGNNGNINGAGWNQPDSVTLYDYSNTPRIADIGITAMAHLCVPIDPAWDLDGDVLLSRCSLGCNDIIPTNLNASVQSPSNITLSWEGNPDSYRHQVKGRPLGAPGFGKFITFAESKNVGNLEAGQTYEWQVRTQCLDGNVSGFSPLDTFMMPTAKLNAGSLSETLNLYPNPVSDKLIVEINHDEGEIWERWLIYNAIGRTVAEGQILANESAQKKIEVPVSQYIQGLYFLELKGSGVQHSISFEILRP